MDPAFSVGTNFTTYSIFTGFYFPSPNLSSVTGAHHYNVSFSFTNSNSKILIRI